jgi:hypothetical protein
MRDLGQLDATQRPWRTTRVRISAGFSPVKGRFFLFGKADC